MRERGSIAVEAALIMPVVFAAISGVLVLGVRLSDHMFLTQATREVAMILARTPYMAALTAPRGSSPYTIDLTSSLDESASVQTSLSKLNGTSVTPCGSAGSRYSECLDEARSVVQWYATQAYKLKRMMVSNTITLTVTFGPAAGNPSALTGLCTITVNATANVTGWLTYISEAVTVSQTAPYLSYPVPRAGQGCVPEGEV